jgi:hypothetical protein
VAIAPYSVVLAMLCFRLPHEGLRICTVPVPHWIGNGVCYGEPYYITVESEFDGGDYEGVDALNPCPKSLLRLILFNPCR